MAVCIVRADGEVVVKGTTIKRYTDQDIKTAYDRGFTQGYNEGCKDTEEELKYKDEDEGWN